MTGNYTEIFGHPPRLSRHAIERMNTSGIAPQRLAEALSNPAIRGTSPETINFIGGGIVAVVDDAGVVVTVYWAA